jgi:hypothetical protein
MRLHLAAAMPVLVLATLIAAAGAAGAAASQPQKQQCSAPGSGFVGGSDSVIVDLTVPVRASDCVLVCMHLRFLQRGSGVGTLACSAAAALLFLAPCVENKPHAHPHKTTKTTHNNQQQ